MKHFVMVLMITIIGAISVCPKNAQAWTAPIANYNVSNGFWDCARRCYHLGDDIRADANTEVVSIGDGVVKEVTFKNNAGNYGGRVLIQYETPTGPVVVIYGHLGIDDDHDRRADDIYVHVGDQVHAGQAIGRLGTREENGGFTPHLHIGIHKGAYNATGVVCNSWIYAGYTLSAYRAEQACYCDVYNGWIDPGEFLGIERKMLAIVDASVEPTDGELGDEFTWNLEATGRLSAPVHAQVLIRNPVTGEEFPFDMQYVEGSTNPYEFSYSKTPLSSGRYEYRYQLNICGETVSEEARRVGPEVRDGEGQVPDPPPNPPTAAPSNPPSSPPSNPPPAPPTQPACQPIQEICDNVDNDCDGWTDEDITRPCQSACGPGQEQCNNGQWSNCNAPQPTPEICDGQNNDCDQFIDEELTRPCNNQCGNAGIEGCINGNWLGCNAPGCPAPQPPTQPPTQPPAPPTQPATQPPPPAHVDVAPAQTGPGNNIVIQVPFGQAASVSLQWNAVQNATRYEYMIGYGGSAGPLITQNSTPSTSTDFGIQQSSYGTELKWRIRGISADGTTGPWSVYQTFFFTHPLRSYIQCANNACPFQGAWYKVSSDTYNQPEAPRLMILDFVNDQCGRGHQATQLNMNQMNSYSRSQRFNGCPP